MNNFFQNSKSALINENMYPEIHKMVMPYIDEVLDTINDPDNVTEETLNKLSQQVITKSNLNASALPAGHNERTINDIVRGLILSELLFGGQFNNAILFPFFFPQFGRFPIGRPPRYPGWRRRRF